MEKFRCPTCLTLLDGDERRCPACRSRLVKRTQPIVLGDRARIASRPPLPRESQMLARAQALSARERPASDDAKADSSSPRVIDRWFANAPEPQHTGITQFAPAFGREPEPVEALLAVEADAEIGHTDVPAPLPSPAPVNIERLPRVGGDIHEIFEALHRKARAQDDDISALGLDASNFSQSEARGRRRWHLDFRTRRSESDSTGA
jgi:hypothetical protein